MYHLVPQSSVMREGRQTHIHRERSGAEADVALVETPHHQGVAGGQQNPLADVKLIPLVSDNNRDMGCVAYTGLELGEILGGWDA